MPEIGDQIQLVAVKVQQAPRTGVVTAVRGGMLTVRWSSGEQSVVVPAPGTLTIIGRAAAEKTTPKAAKAKTAKSARSKKAAR
jgi:uncharacterized protein DUF1918